MKEISRIGGDELVGAPLSESDATGDSPHLVQFYEDDTFLVDAVARFIGTALGAGDAGVVIATPPHLDRLAAQLRARGLDVTTIREQGRYVPLDAAGTLSKIMVNGWPDDTRFAQVVGDAIARVATPDHARVRAFGEMVGLLWAEGKPEAAIRLEELWNDLARKLPFSLLCACSLADFGREADEAPFLRICGEHSHVIPAESYTALDSPDERLRAITQLQRKARMLERQIAERNEVESILNLEQKQVETLRARLAAIVESSDDAIVGKTLDGIVTSWNAGAERLFGYTAEEMIGKPIARIIPPEAQDDLPKILNAVRRGKRVEHFETERVRKDGRRIHVSLTVSPIKDADGCVIGASKIARDVSDRKRSDAAKDEFLAMLGHELRNPLAAVQSAITTARLDPSRRERALDIARRQAVQLRRLVDDLLDVARITQGKIVLRKERIFLTSVVERALETARAQIDERGHTLSVSLPDDLKVDADTGRMEQVLANLLTNAAKYTPPGGRIEVVAEPEGGEIVVRVRDNGIGISAEMLPYVFDLFSQADQGLERSHGGLGLGLALVRRLVELHGGRVAARSGGCGTGAEFAVHLPAPDGPEPLQPADAQEVSGAGRRAARRARVLIVEDNVDAADTLAMLLEILGHQVEIAHDGVAGLEAMQRTPPDVMLVDIGLPGIDGFEVARRARALPGSNAMLLVALTGYGRDEDKERTRTAGFDYHLTKPIEIDALKALVAGRGQSEPQPDASGTVH